jgi:hypothetical protein
MANGEEMTTPEQIEAVARAMSDTEWGEGYWNELTSPARREYKRQAASAIDTMRPLIRAEALGEAAVTCDRYAKNDWKLGEGFRSLAGIELAADIRALKDT